MKSLGKSGGGCDASPTVISTAAREECVGGLGRPVDENDAVRVGVAVAEIIARLEHKRVEKRAAIRRTVEVSPLCSVDAGTADHGQSLSIGGKCGSIASNVDNCGFQSGRSQPFKVLR
ncbi:hypothetical protein Pan3_50 [Pseudanabaena phage Pan3]|nr:hypothetical protein Pan3_50 [Pseudanabaena phage Pan3]